MNSLNNLIGLCIEDINGEYGSLVQKIILDSSWIENNKRLPPVLLQFERSAVVLHKNDGKTNLKRFGYMLKEKNVSNKITTNLIQLNDDFFVTEYIEGEVLANNPKLINIETIAKTQYLFNEYAGVPDLNDWNTLLNNAKEYLQKQKLLDPKDIPQISFTNFGLIHGDYDVKNIIKSHDKNIIIDIENMMYGPLAYDLARPLKRICSTAEERQKYLSAHDSKKVISNEELSYGVILLHLIQAFNRAKWGYLKEASISIKNMNDEVSRSGI